MGLFNRGDGSVGDSDTTSGVGAGEGTPDVSALRDEITDARKTRSDKGRKRGPRSVGSGNSEITREEIDALFQAENWEALAALPFDTRYVMTGWAGFRLSDEERKRLAQTTATTMKVLLKIDPKYIALMVWGTVYFGTWAGKEATFAQLKQNQRAQSRAQQHVVTGTEDRKTA